ncbi:MAG: polymer-forming cytoskeletal protein [Pseudomonadota bacterium]
MFTRSAPPQPPSPPASPGQVPAVAAPPAQAAAAEPVPFPQTAGRKPADSETVSVIGRDLTIMGTGLRIVTKGTLRVDGSVQGDVLGSTVVITQHGKVTGRVHAERVTIEGAVEGSVRGVEVSLAANSKVEGDIHHASLGIAQGASFDGRSRREADAGKLKPDLDVAAASGAAPEAGATNGAAAAPSSLTPAPAPSPATTG